MNKSESAPTFKEIWAILKETAISQKDTDRKLKAFMQETDRWIQESKQEADRRKQEADRRKQEADRRKQEFDREIQESKKETDRIRQETAREIKSLAKEDKKLKHLFTNGWGALVESLVSGCLIRLLRKRGIEVTALFSNVSNATHSTQPDKRCEIDILARNGNELVATEVKSTLGKKDVDHYLEVLKDFFSFFPEYKGRKVYGATAYLKVQHGADIYAERKGLFVIKATGDSACITNNKNFKPKDFA